MTPIKKLVRVFANEVRGEFHLTLEAEDGQIFQVRANEGQISDLIQNLEDLLNEDEEDDLTVSKELGDE